MKGLSFLGIFSLVLFLLLGGIFLFHACFHNDDFWSLFIFVPGVMAFFSPAVCFGYADRDAQERNMPTLYPETRHACVEMGWAVAGVLLLGAYGIPVLAWYNARLHWTGVLEVDAALNCWVYAYIIWLRIFVFHG